MEDLENIDSQKVLKDLENSNPEFKDSILCLKIFYTEVANRLRFERDQDVIKRINKNISQLENQVKNDLGDSIHRRMTHDPSVNFKRVEFKLH